MSEPKRRAAETFVPGGLTIAFAPSSGSTSTSQPQQSGGLFGSTATAQPQQSGGLFGGGATSQPAQSGGLFGGAAQQPQQSGGLFGASTAASQPAQSGGLFGGTNTTPQPSGGLFGNTGNNTQQSGGGLFGGNAQQSQPQQSGGLFGGTLGGNQNNAQSGGGLFGGLGQNQNQNQNQPQQQQGGGLFGGLGTQNKPAGSSLFGGSTAQQQQLQNTQQSSMFGNSLFNKSTAPLAGSLTMGQGNQQQQTVPGTKIDLSNVRPTTRFADLHDELKKELENIDDFIRNQENLCTQCEAMMPAHSSNLSTIPPDVDLINSKLETVELALENDSRVIEQAKELEKGDRKDLERCMRVIENLRLPSQFHYVGSSSSYGRSRAAAQSPGEEEGYDVDLVSYFDREAAAMQETLEMYNGHLAEIEQHLRVVEASTMQQGQAMMAQRGAGSEDTVRELADTLRGFEDGILGAAGLVGACREGVNELVLGKAGGDRGFSRSGRY